MRFVIRKMTRERKYQASELTTKLLCKVVEGVERSLS